LLFLRRKKLQILISIRIQSL